MIKHVVVIETPDGVRISKARLHLSLLEAASNTLIGIPFVFQSRINVRSAVAATYEMCNVSDPEEGL